MSRYRDLASNYLQTQKFKPESCFFLDEIGDCKVKVYSNQLSKSELAKLKRLDEVRIILGTSGRRYKYIRLYYDSSANTIYFGKSRLKYVSDCLGSYGYAVNSEERDEYKFTLRDGQPAISKRKYIHPKLQSWRDNANILFILDKITNTIHDKSCEHLQKIPIDWLAPFEGYLLDINYCEDCRDRLHIRLACGDDFKNYTAYKNFLERGKLRKSQIELFIRHRDFKMHLKSPGELQIKVNEDFWIIKRIADNKYVLMHNNYSVLDNGERYVPGVNFDKFHIQKRADKLYPLFLTICNYSYSDHPAANTNNEEKSINASWLKKLLHI